MAILASLNRVKFPLLGAAALVGAVAIGATRVELESATSAVVPVLATLDAAERSWDAPTADADRIVLTWSGDPATTQSVTWRTDVSVTDGVAQVAPATPHPGFSLAATTVPATTGMVDASRADGEHVVANFHSATFTGLTPATLYAYRVGDGERWSEWFQFRTASDAPEPFSFVYFGDAQNDILSLWSRVVRASVFEAPDARFMIHAGDLVNEAHRNDEWGEWFRAGGFLLSMIPSLPTPGNHEYDELGGRRDELSQFWEAQFALPMNGPEGVDGETAYYVDFQGVRIVSLNSNRDRDAQARWLDRILAENPQRWTIVTHHHPVFSASGDRDNERIRDAWKPVYDRHGVDLVLQGHDHSYARGRTAANVPSGVNVRDDETGTVYVVSVSGRKMYQLKRNGWADYDAELDRGAENTQLFQVIRVDGDRLTYRAVTPDGTLYDAFELVKQDGRPNRLVEMSPGMAETFRFDGTDPYTW